MKNCEKQDLLMNSETEAYCKKLKKSILSTLLFKEGVYNVEIDVVSSNFSRKNF